MAKAERQPNPIANAEAWRAARLAKTKSGRCWVCNIRQAEIVNELRRAGWGIKELMTYLVEVHKHTPEDASRHRLQSHCYGGHHEKTK